MFCPRCGATAAEEQKFCKLCGSNLQVIADALQGVSVLDGLDALKRNLKVGVVLGSRLRGSGKDAWSRSKTERQTTRELRRKRRERGHPLRYTRAYNLQRGIYKLISGSATTAVLYSFFNLGGAPWIARFIQEILESSPGIPTAISSVEPILRLLWLLGLVSIGKGFAYLINGLFFAKSIDQLYAEEQARGTPETQPAPLTTTIGGGAPSSPPPPSVAEHTTFHLKGESYEGLPRKNADEASVIE